MRSPLPVAFPAWAAPVLVTALAIGCGGGDTTSSSSTGGNSEPGHVTGTIRDTRVTEAGESEHPVDPTSVTIRALVRAGTVVTVHQGTLLADGSFTIHGVPVGQYTLELAVNGEPPTFYDTTERKLDLGSLRPGRFDAVAPTHPTALTINAGGLTAWQDTDTLEAFSKGAGAWDGFGILAFTGLLTGGQTSLDAFTVNTAAWHTPALIEGSLGDRATITHLTTRASGTLTYQAVAEAFTPAPFTQVDGQPAVISGDFMPVAQTHVALNVDRVFMDKVASTAGTAVTVTGHVIDIYVDPGGAGRMSLGPKPTLLHCTDTETAGSTVALDFGDPFPTGWTRLFSAGTTYTRFYTVPGMATPFNLNGFTGIIDPIDETKTLTVTTVLGPPQDLKIAGRDASVDVTGVGLTPLITWSPGVIAGTSVYDLSIRQLIAGKSPKRVARLVTTQHFVNVPPGIFTAGATYAVVITARSSYKPSQPDFTLTPGYAAADALTGLITP